MEQQTTGSPPRYKPSSTGGKSANKAYRFILRPIIEDAPDDFLENFLTKAAEKELYKALKTKSCET